MSKFNPEERLFIDGALVAAEGGQTYNVINPATEEVAGIVAAASPADGDRALAAARRVRTGTMNVNGAFFLAPNAPFGGYKQSGIGRESGVEGFEEYLETKTIAVPVDYPTRLEAVGVL